MNQPSRSPRPRGSSGLQGLGDYPHYYDQSGAEIMQIECGVPFTFDVPGYSHVRLQVIKDGVPTFDGPFDVPMPFYSGICGVDEGHYQAIAYDPVTDVEIGQTELTIKPSTSIFAGMSTSTMMLLGGGVLLLLFAGKKVKK